MNWLVERPSAVYEPEKGLFQNEHFQVAYVTNDMDRACDIFSTRFGIEKFAEIGGETPSGGDIKVKLAWLDSTMYELIRCTGPKSEMYNQILPAHSDFSMKFHHLGYFVPDVASWDALKKCISDGGWEITQENNNEGFMRHCYINVPELGHHLEYIFPEKAGLDFFSTVPAN